AGLEPLLPRDEPGPRGPHLRLARERRPDPLQREHESAGVPRHRLRQPRPGGLCALPPRRWRRQQVLVLIALADAPLAARTSAVSPNGRRVNPPGGRWGVLGEVVRDCGPALEAPTCPVGAHRSCTSPAPARP